ncbi:MAG: CRISPR-associated helicase Cas3', partial [Deferribacterales bacterium]|nr:CRISPR-associated helicase Cas3' [Deferribacterales bacterium]
MSDTGKCNFDNYIAKTYQVDGKTYAGRSVLEHCIIVGEVCKALLELLPPALKKYFHKDTPFLAALHDIGKVSPTFQKKISNSIDNHPLKDELINVNSDIEKNWGGHAGVGEITLEYIIDEYLQNRREYKYLPLIAGLHHGSHSRKECRSTTSSNSKVLGGKHWNNLRINHFDSLKDYFKCNIEPLNDELIATITIGLTIVSDWIGSSRTFDNPKIDYNLLIDKALEEIGFKNNLIKGGLSFEDIFGFKQRKSQEELINICDKEGVYILEAPMGIGKTEAALYCAYKILEKGLARGIYFALPTQITSNKIYYRFKPFIEKISENKEFIKLLHSNSKIYQLGSDADIGASWFDTSKRGLLAPFAVGTIDQALMAVMNVKHYPVRAFGLFGKVVILDEVHSYDTYTGTILDELVKKLKNMGCTVIILSATLTKERKEKIANIKSLKNSYPLITAYKDDELYEEEVEYSDNKEVEIKYLNTENAIGEAIEAALSGLQVLWIENTVNKAQEIYTLIKSMTNIECGLLHSRFIKRDRKDIEDNWVEIFSHTNNRRYNNGRILIGTQVLEQSIDIDADLL